MKKNKKVKKSFKKTIKEVWREDKSSVIRIAAFGLFFVGIIIFVTGLANFIPLLPTVNVPFLIAMAVSLVLAIASLSTAVYCEVSHDKLQKK